MVQKRNSQRKQFRPIQCWVCKLPIRAQRDGIKFHKWFVHLWCLGRARNLTNNGGQFWDIT